MAPVTFHLRDRARTMVDAWQRYFDGHPEIRPAVGDIFGEPVDAVVSPANCFGFMNGGIDRAYTQRFGQQLETRLRELIRRDWDGELPVGLALPIETGAPDIPYLICAPTLRAPVNVANTLNAYLAFRAVLRVVRRLNEKHPGAVRAVACPGLGTGTGEMPEAVCAKQMQAAYLEVMSDQPFEPSGVNDALVQHYRLLRTD
jgi:O-acetyl-ADP-ribose deacetylase (regulator of RNase III)